MPYIIKRKKFHLISERQKWLQFALLKSEESLSKIVCRLKVVWRGQNFKYIFRYQIITSLISLFSYNITLWLSNGLSGEVIKWRESFQCKLFYRSSSSSPERLFIGKQHKKQQLIWKWLSYSHSRPSLEGPSVTLNLCDYGYMLIPIDIKSPLIKFWPHSKMGSCGVWNYVTRYWRQKEYKSGLPHFSRSQFSTFLSLRGGRDKARGFQ